MLEYEDSLGSTTVQVPSCWKSALFRQSHPETAAR